MKRCGSTVSVRTCTCCGEDRQESGSYAGAKRTCKARACPYCSWVRARKVGEFYEKAGEELEGLPGYKWQMLTITTRYNPRAHGDVTWQALRSRAKLCLKAAQVLWKRLGRAPKVAMFRSIECSMRGHVHCHVLFLGPEVDADEITTYLQQKVGAGLGYVYASTLDGDDGGGGGNHLPPRAEEEEVATRRSSLAVAVGRAAKYMAKGTTGYVVQSNEGFLGMEEGAKTIHPVLAARWEIAVYGMRLTARYGLLRGVDFSEGDYSYTPPDDSKVACSKCGAQGRWETSYRKAEVFIQDMHADGKRALEGSGWVPWWRRKKRDRGTGLTIERGWITCKKRLPV